MTPNDGSAWETSVDALIRLFRDALLALIPIIEKAQVPWREGEAYDAWDEIATVLYAKLVREPLAWALDAVSDFNLAGYDLALSTWRDTSFVAAKHSSLPPQSTAVFLRFGTQARPLDTVVVTVLDDAFAPHGGEKRLPFKDVTFELKRRKGDRHRAITSVTVPK